MKLVKPTVFKSYIFSIQIFWYFSFFNFYKLQLIRIINHFDKLKFLVKIQVLSLNLKLEPVQTPNNRAINKNKIIFNEFSDFMDSKLKSLSQKNIIKKYPIEAINVIIIFLFILFKFSSKATFKE